MAASHLLLFLLAVKITSCSALWLNDNDYEDAGPAVVDDVTSAERRNLLLSLLMRASMLDGEKQQRLDAEGADPRAYRPEDSDPRLEELDDTSSFLKEALGRVERRMPSKRARSHISSVLPPFGEMCRAMHIGGCSHSRHR